MHLSPRVVKIAACLLGALAAVAVSYAAGMSTGYEYDAAGNLKSITTCNSGVPCHGQCLASVSSDINNCGACGKVCPGASNGSATCNNGSCGLTCDSGYLLCNGVCVRNDTNNCGTCGNKCSAAPANATTVCNNGSCGFTCNSGYTNCSGTCRALATDINNCGTCGHVCGNLPNATATCTGGTCQVASCTQVLWSPGGDIDPGWFNTANCNGNPSDGCETVMGTRSNCSYCGEVCATNYICTSSGCVYDNGGGGQ